VKQFQQRRRSENKQKKREFYQRVLIKLHIYRDSLYQTIWLKTKHLVVEKVRQMFEVIQRKTKMNNISSKDPTLKLVQTRSKISNFGGTTFQKSLGMTHKLGIRSHINNYFEKGVVL